MCSCFTSSPVGLAAGAHIEPLGPHARRRPRRARNPVAAVLVTNATVCSLIASSQRFPVPSQEFQFVRIIVAVRIIMAAIFVIIAAARMLSIIAAGRSWDRPPGRSTKRGLQAAVGARALV